MSMFEPTEGDTQRISKKTNKKKSSKRIKKTTYSVNIESTADEEDEDNNTTDPSATQKLLTADKGDDILEYIFNKKSTVIKPSQHTSASTDPANVAAIREKELLLLERKRFMSHKASHIVSEISSSLQVKNGGVIGKARHDGSGMSREEFEKIKREINLYGMF